MTKHNTNNSDAIRNSWCKMIWINLGRVFPLNNDITDLGRDQKYGEIMKRASKKHFCF